MLDMKTQSPDLLGAKQIFPLDFKFSTYHIISLDFFKSFFPLTHFTLYGKSSY